MSFRIAEVLENYKKSGFVRFHMPGHAGKSVSSLLDRIYPYDVTELDFTDDLHFPGKGGIFEEMESYLREVTSAADVLISCAGSTSMIQTSVTAALRRRRAKILCERNVHLSVVNAIALNRGEVEWMNDVCAELPGKISGEESCVIVTSPDYFGKIHDIEKISSVCKKYRVPLITDTAHGAHLEFFAGGEFSVFRKGASLSAESLHKTLPSLTGSAVLLSDGTFSRDELLFARRKFASSSPSYVISLSIAECLRFMDLCGNERLSSLMENVAYTKKSLGNLGFGTGSGSVFSDPFRIRISTGNVISPPALAGFLSEKNIVPEFCTGSEVVLIPSVLHEKGDFDRLISVCETAVRGQGGKPYTPSEFSAPYPFPQVRMSMWDAVSMPFETVNTENSLDRVCAEPVYLYPPGVPVVMPGEVFGLRCIEYLKSIGIDRVSAVDFRSVPERKF